MPLRTCLACRGVRDKALLVRLVCKDGTIEADLKGGLPGRGAYVCPEKRCVEAALRKDQLSRALKRGVRIPDPDGLWETIKKGRP